MTPETNNTTETNRLGLFVFFDFQFFPMRVHSGNRRIDWDGQEWIGIGDVLREDALSTSSLISSTHQSRDKMAASVPLDKRTQEIMSREYYRGRPMEWSICSLDKNARVIERVYHNVGTMVSCRTRDDVLNFTAEVDFIDSTTEKDLRHKRTVVAVRERFKWKLVDHGSFQGIAWIVNACLAVSGQVLGFVFDVFRYFVSGSSRRRVAQRWAARKRVFWFRTEPPIPGLRPRKHGYKIRADTLEEAKTKLYERVAKVVWKFPRGYIRIHVYIEGQPVHMLNIDLMREQDDPQRWSDTDPIAHWLRLNNEKLANDDRKAHR